MSAEGTPPVQGVLGGGMEGTRARIVAVMKPSPKTAAVPPAVLSALEAGLRYRLAPASCAMVVVPEDLRTGLRGRWPGVVVAGRFGEGAPQGLLGVWMASASGRLDEGIVDLRPVVAVDEGARAWSVWCDRLHPAGRLHVTVDEVVASGLVDVVLAQLGA